MFCAVYVRLARVRPARLYTTAAAPLVHTAADSSAQLCVESASAVASSRRAATRPGQAQDTVFLVTHRVRNETIKRSTRTTLPSSGHPYGCGCGLTVTKRTHSGDRTAGANREPPPSSDTLTVHWHTEKWTQVQKTPQEGNCCLRGHRHHLGSHIILAIFTAIFTAVAQNSSGQLTAPACPANDRHYYYYRRFVMCTSSRLTPLRLSNHRHRNAVSFCTSSSPRP